MAADLKAQKQQLRTQMKETLAKLTQEQLTRQAHAAVATITGLQQYQKARRISIYLSMPSAELQTDALIKDAFQNGKKVFVPHLIRPPTAEGQTKKRKVMEMLRLASHEEFTGLKRDAWGIPTLPTDGLAERENALSLSNGNASEGIDMIVVPGVAFDRSMGRLGHGAGFYDSYLTRCTEIMSSRSFLAGLCLEEQLLPTAELVPMADHDWRMDAVVAGDLGLLERA